MLTAKKQNADDQQKGEQSSRSQTGLQMPAKDLGYRADNGRAGGAAQITGKSQHSK